jgi:hypothetical protein
MQSRKGFNALGRRNKMPHKSGRLGYKSSPGHIKPKPKRTSPLKKGKGKN